MVGWTRCVAAILASLGLFADIGELALNIVFATSAPAMLGQAPAWAHSVLLGSVFAGGFVGAPLFGILADRYGRRTSLQISMAMVVLTSIAGALSPSVWFFVACRFLSGIALGAYPALMTAWLAEILPAGRRAQITLLVDSVGFLGAPALVFLIYWLNGVPSLPFESWRLALLIAAAMALVCSLGLSFVPESPRWLMVRGRTDAAHQAALRFGGSLPAMPWDAAAPDRPQHVSTLSSRELRRRALLIFAVYALRPVPTVIFPIMVGVVMRQKGFPLDVALFVAAASSFGGAAGTLCAAFVIDRVERRSALAACGALLVLFGLAFGAAQDVVLLQASAGLFLTVGAVFGPVLSVYAAEIVPTPVRATITATAWSVTRLTSAVLPIFLLPMLAVQGFWSFVAAVLASVVLSVALIGLWGPEQKAGRPIL